MWLLVYGRKLTPDFPFFNMAFAAGAAAATGVKHGLNALGKTDYTVMCFAGDGSIPISVFKV